jgi:hypothetical protein
MAGETDKDAAEEALDEYEQLDADPAPPVDFNTFILSLGTSAAMNLGERDKSEINLPMARQSIDMLALLEEKTKGNLTGEEERLLAQLLYELRVRYVGVARAREG